MPPPKDGSGRPHGVQHDRERPVRHLMNSSARFLRELSKKVAARQVPAHR
jgi:hypothetical protein